MAGLDSYNSNRKNNWRAWVWNRIAERLFVRKDSANILYLTGPDANDAREAFHRGFDALRLIGVDRDRGCVASIRKQGLLASCVDWTTAAKHWRGAPFDVVHLDFCGGCTDATYNALVSLCAGEYSGIQKRFVLSCNMLRGRDGMSGNDVLSHMLTLTGWQINARHRGLAALNAAVVGAVIRHAKTETIEGINLRGPRRYRTEHQLLLSAIATSLHCCDPAFISYRAESGKNLYDSVVMRIDTTRRLVASDCGDFEEPRQLEKARLTALLAVQSRWMAQYKDRGLKFTARH